VTKIHFADVWLQLSFWVLIVLWHNEWAECAVLRALSPPAFRFVTRLIFVEWRWNTGKYWAKLGGFEYQLHDYWSDRKSETGRWLSGSHWTMHVLTMSQCIQNSNSSLGPKLLVWNAGFLVGKLAQLQQSGLQCGKTLCNGLDPVPNQTRNCSSRLEPLLNVIRVCCIPIPYKAIWT